MKKLYWLLFFVISTTLSTSAQFKHLQGPAENGRFGSNITVLPNGNYAISDPRYDEDGVQDIGAVFVYDGKTHELIASVKGTQANDLVGNGIYAFNDNTLFIISFYWNANKGAITLFPIEKNKHWKVSASNSIVGTRASDIASLLFSYPINGKAIISISSWNENRGAIVAYSIDSPQNGPISASNAFVGKYVGDRLGSNGFQIIGQKIVVASPWYHGLRGMASVLDINNPIVGEIDATNSLIGERPTDQIGTYLLPLKNSSHVVIGSSYWNEERGATTLIDLNKPIVGFITAENSLIGTNPSDRISSSGVYALENGNFVVASSFYNQKRGAVTFVEPSKGLIGRITPQNSIVGQEPNDLVGYSTKVLPNGNVLNINPSWNNNRGAVTWIDGQKGIAGYITPTNSLLGINPNDVVGHKVEILTNSDYAVFSTNSIAQKKAITWGDGTKGITGTPTPENSLTGLANMSPQFLTLTKLSNGNTVFCNFDWNNFRGAVTFIKEGNYPTGPISAANSIVGEHEYDRVGSGGVIALTNGNYAFSSPSWSTNKGAVTWGNGDTGTKGTISAQNSLVGIATDQLRPTIHALSNGNYVAHTALNHIDQTGKVTWGNGTTGSFGELNETNSLTKEQHRITNITPLKNGHYVVNGYNDITSTSTMTWMNGNKLASGKISIENSLVSDNGDLGFGATTSPIIQLNNNDFLVYSPFLNKNMGSVTWVDGNKGISGPINETNSILGSSTQDGASMFPVYNYPLNYLMVGRPGANTVSIFNPYHEVVTGIEEILSPKAKYTTLYPNPSSSYSAIKSQREQSELIAVKLMNTSGQVLSFQTGAISKNISLELSLHHLVPGVYLVEVQGSDFQETHRLVKE